MSYSSSSVVVNFPILRDIYRDILAKSGPLNGLHNVCPLAFSGRNSLNAFWQVVSDVPEATIENEIPQRIDLTLYKKGTLSIFQTHGSFGLRILDHSTRNIKKLTVEGAPIWTRNWLKEFVDHDGLKELYIGRKVEWCSFEILAQIAESVKILTDERGHIVRMLNRGDFDYLSVRMINILMADNSLSSVNFTASYLHCVVDKDYVKLGMIAQDLAKVSSEKLSAVKTFHVVFNYYRTQNNFQPFIDTIVEVMPNVKNIVLTLKLVNPKKIEVYSYKSLPWNIGKTYEAIKNLIPPLGVAIKTEVFSEIEMETESRSLELDRWALTYLRRMKRVPLDENVKTAKVIRALESEPNRYQQYEFDAENELGTQKEFRSKVIVYVQRYLE